MDKNYYLEYFRLEREHWWFKVRNKIIIGHIKSLLAHKEGTLKILNIGVATGYTSQLLEEVGEVQSVEYDKDCFEFVKSQLDISIVNASILDLPFDDETFDLVCAFDVIEHVEDDLKAVREMKRVCKADGHLCVTVPAFMFLWSDHDEVNHHFRRYKIPGLVKVFEQSSKIHYVSYFNTFLFLPIALIRVIGSIKKSQKSTEQKSSDFGMFNNKFINKLLYSIFQAEIPLLKRKFKFPFGISIILSYRK